MKTLILTLLLLTLVPAPQDLESKVKTFRNNKRFSVKFDRFRNETRVAVGPFFVGGTGSYVIRGRQLEMSALFFRSSGETVKTVYLLFQGRSREWMFLKDSELLALVDGERIQFGDADRDSDVRLGGGVSETLVYSIPVEQFIKIGNAGTAELKIGRVELSLKDEHKEAFRDLLNLSR